MTEEPPHTRSFREKMLRYRGNIDNELYKAEQACDSVQDINACTNQDCPWSDHVKGCKMLGIRFILGDHVEHSDIPQCDTGDVVK